MENSSSNTLEFFDHEKQPINTRDKIIYLSNNKKNNHIYLNANAQRSNIRHVLKIEKKTLRISKVMYLSADCDHLFTFIGILGLFEVHGGFFLVGISQALEYKVGWGKIYKVVRLKVIDLQILEENENYAGLLSSYFGKGFYFSYDFDLTAMNGK